MLKSKSLHIVADDPDSAIGQLETLRSDKVPFAEVWIQSGTARLYALFNGDVGWMMFLRNDGDPGFSSRNPEYRGPKEDVLEYFLGNGQRDVYPASWAYPASVVFDAMAQFARAGTVPMGLHWHNDSSDGEPSPPTDE